MSDSDWISRFLCSETGRLFCRIDNAFLTDKFGWYELESMVPNYNTARDVMFGDAEDIDQDYQEEAHMLYGLLHARFIKEPRGILQMATKYNNKEFGVCPRHFCREHALLPCGLYDQFSQEKMRLYCARCEDVYVPSNAAHKRIDGAFFGTAFPHLLFLNVPKLLPQSHHGRPREKYEAQIYGFRLHPKWHQVASQALDDHSHMAAIYDAPRALDNNALQQQIKTQQSEIERLQMQILKMKQTGTCTTCNGSNGDERTSTGLMAGRDEHNKNSSDDSKEDCAANELPLDADEYKEWSIAQILQWINSLENGRFSVHREIVQKGLEAQNIHKGEWLSLFRVDELKRENVKDANDLMQHIQSLLEEEE